MLCPDKWVLLKYNGDLFVFSSWSGSYLGQDSWRRSTKIIEHLRNGAYIEVITASGTKYSLNKFNYGISHLWQHKIDHYLSKYEDMIIIQDWENYLS